MYIGALKPGSNRATYIETFQLYDDEDSEGIDLTEATIVLEVRKPGSSSAKLSATNSDGIEITDSDDGQFELTFTVDQMRGLDPMTYECGITIEQNDETIQYFIGTLAVLDGIVT